MKNFETLTSTIENNMEYNPAQTEKIIIITDHLGAEFFMRK